MYSVRMRATGEKRHISGAENLVEKNRIIKAAESLIERALSHERGSPDFINISIEEIKSPVRYLASLPVTIFPVRDVDEGKSAARKILAHLGIPGSCIEKAFTLLENGAADGESMRGAIIMDMHGRRLEPDKQRGIRASRMDMSEEAELELADSLESKGLSGYCTHVKEALVLATKVASMRGSIAELCWSDDPFYTTGYVASKKLGYVRIPHLKHERDCRGGRVFFVEDINLGDYFDEMENGAVLINKFAGIKEVPHFNDIIGE